MGLPQNVLESLKRGFLAELGEARLTELFAGGIPFEVPQGTVVGRPEDEGRVALILSGIFRMYFTDISGRSVTVRYVGAGEFMGLPAMVGGPVELSVDCILEKKATVWVIPAGGLREECRRDARLCWLITQEITRRLYGVLKDRFEDPFSSLRDRVVKHLSLMADCQEADKRPAHLDISQQTLADTVGSSREAVARVLKELREDEAVKTTSAGITLLK